MVTEIGRFIHSDGMGCHFVFQTDDMSGDERVSSSARIRREPWQPHIQNQPNASRD